MRNANQIRDERDALLANLTALLDRSDAEHRDLTPDEQHQYDQGMTRVAALNEQMTNARYAERTGYPRGPTPRPQPSADLDALDAPRSLSVQRFHAGTRLQAFPDTRAGHEAAYRSGMWLRAALVGEAKALDWCQQHGMGVDIRAAHSAGENAKGGVLVPEEMSTTIIRLVEQYGVFRRNVRVVPMTSDTLNIPRRTGGLTAHYVGENVEGTESDTAWDNVALVAKKMMILSRMSSEIAEDAIISMADMLALEAALAFALKEDTVGFTGTGISTDGGITGVLVKALEAAHPLASVTASGAGNSCDTFSEITADHLLELMGATAGYAKAGARWYCSPVAMELVFNAIKIAGGGNSFDNLANAVQPRFLGYPIELSEVFPSDITADLSGAAMIAFGNLAQAATLGSRREIRFATTDSRYWEQDQIGVKATMRHDINAHDLGSASIKSPFCVLVGN
jgi:HK97 family phage major capsid protein